VPRLGFACDLAGSREPLKSSQAEGWRVTGSQSSSGVQDGFEGSFPPRDSVCQGRVQCIFRAGSLVSR